ncbi:hypothetical protein [Mesorhizobium amorphae]
MFFIWSATQLDDLTPRHFLSAFPTYVSAAGLCVSRIVPSVRLSALAPSSAAKVAATLRRPCAEDGFLTAIAPDFLPDYSSMTVTGRYRLVFKLLSTDSWRFVRKDGKPVELDTAYQVI